MMGLVRIPFLLAACLYVAGCGGDSAPEPKAGGSAPAGTAPTDSRPVIAAFGNSLSAGLGVDPGKTYPDFLQQLLDERGYSYRVVNAGISGDTSGGGVDRLESVIALKPAIVVLELGANDGLRGLPISTTRANLEEMIVRLKQAGAQVVLAGMTLPRNYGAAYIRSFEAVFVELAKKHSLPLIPFLLRGVAEEGRHMQADRLHPTVEGNRLVAANVMEIIEPLLKRSAASPRRRLP
jgi:acyl-CoA thioesterase-1